MMIFLWMVSVHGSWTIDQSRDFWSWVNWTILDSVIQPDGKIIIVWSFTSYRWSLTRNIARLNQDWSLDTTFAHGSNGWCNGTIKTVALHTSGAHNQKIMIWWDFSQCGAWVASDRIARLLPSGIVDESLQVRWFNGTVHDIHIENEWASIQTYLVGGNFSLCQNKAWWFTTPLWITRISDQSCSASTPFHIQNKITHDALSLLTGNWLSNQPDTSVRSIHHFRFMGQDRLLLGWKFRYDGYKEDNLGQWWPVSYHDFLLVSNNGVIPRSFNGSSWAEHSSIMGLVRRVWFDNSTNTILLFGDFESFGGISSYWGVRISLVWTISPMSYSVQWWWIMTYTIYQGQKRVWWSFTWINNYALWWVWLFTWSHTSWWTLIPTPWSEHLWPQKNWWLSWIISTIISHDNSIIIAWDFDSFSWSMSKWLVALRFWCWTWEFLWLDRLSCVSWCPSETLVDQWACVSSCPSARPYNDNGECTATCTLRDWTSCVSSCPSARPYNDNGECTDVCPSGSLLNTQNQSCVASCPLGMFRDGNSCLSWCPIWKYWHEFVCYEQCPWWRLRFTNLCVNQCPSWTFSYNGECRTACPSPLLWYNWECLTQCPTQTNQIDGQCRDRIIQWLPRLMPSRDVPLQSMVTSQAVVFTWSFPISLTSPQAEWSINNWPWQRWTGMIFPWDAFSLRAISSPNHFSDTSIPYNLDGQTQFRRITTHGLFSSILTYTINATWLGFTTVARMTVRETWWPWTLRAQTWIAFLHNGFMAQREIRVRDWDSLTIYAAALTGRQNYRLTAATSGTIMTWNIAITYTPIIYNTWWLQSIGWWQYHGSAYAQQQSTISWYLCRTKYNDFERYGSWATNRASVYKTLVDTIYSRGATPTLSFLQTMKDKPWPLQWLYQQEYRRIQRTHEPLPDEVWVQRMFDLGLTKYNDVDEFGGDRRITREEAARFIVMFYDNVFCHTQMHTSASSTQKNCEFSDIWSSNPELRDFIIQSCQLWFFEGKWWGVFDPKWLLTHAEAMTILTRMVNGRQERKWQRWFSSYLDHASKHHFISSRFPRERPILNTPITRRWWVELLTPWMITQTDMND